jgi:hypothetical protein
MFYAFLCNIHMGFCGSSSVCRGLVTDSSPRQATTDQTSLCRAATKGVHLHRIPKPATPLVPRQKLPQKVHSSVAGFPRNHLAWSCQRLLPPFGSQGHSQGSSHRQVMAAQVLMLWGHQSQPWWRLRTAPHRWKSRREVRLTQAAVGAKNSNRKTLEWSFRRGFLLFLDGGMIFLLSCFVSGIHT